MNSTKFFSKEVKIALAAIASIVILFFGMEFLKGQKLFSSNVSYNVRFNDISGLASASPIFANGYKVGVVERIHFDYNNPEEVVATIGLDKQLKLPQGTRAEISSDMLGNVQLQLLFGSDFSRCLAPGDTIEGTMRMGVMTKAASMLPQIEQMLPKLDSILASVNALMADPALSGSLHNVDRITASLTTTTQQLNRLTTSLNREVPQMLQHADGTLSNTEQLTQKLNSLDLSQTMQRVDATLASVERLTTQLSSREGTLGLLMHDASLYNDITSTMRDVDSLLVDFKLHPRRYINVSVFGRKEK